MAGLTAIPIVALDVPRTLDALALVERLGAECRFYKIGNELFTAEGPDVVKKVRSTGADVFLDLKFHDIPNTVAGAVRSAARLGVRLITVHAAGGLAMLEAAVKAAGDQDRCGILAVSILTSLTNAEVAAAWGRKDELHAGVEVLRLARLATEAGAHGLVCSGREARQVTEELGGRLKVLVPGVRPAGAATQDQARVVTPREAVEGGARYLVLGRAVTAAGDPGDALRRIKAEMAGQKA